MKKILNFMINHYKYIVFILLLVIVNLGLLYELHINKFSGDKKVYFIILAILNIMTIGIYSFIFSKYKNIKLEKLYLIMILPIGVMYMCLFPLNTIPDENTHFVRIYEISSGHLVSKIDQDKKLQGRYFDTNIYESVITATDYKKTIEKIGIRNSGKKEFYHFSNTALYSFICYLPQAIGVIVAKIMHLPLLLQAYMARLFNFIIFVFLTYFSIKLMPMKKASFLLIMLFPIVLQEAVSLSPDALTIATTSFLISFVLHLKKEKDKKITKKEIAILGISSIVLSLCKIVYLPICFINFLIPKEKFESLKKKNIVIISIVVLAIIINLIWLSMSSNFLPDTSGIDSGRQLKYIISNIITYLLVIEKTYITIFDDILYNSFGSSLGCFTISVSRVYIFPLILIFIATILFDNEGFNKNKQILNKYEKGYITLLIFGVIMLISTSLYLQWTPVGNDTILGIQGRYFIPLYFLLTTLFTKYKLSPKVNFTNKYTYIFLIAINIYALSAVFYNFI